MIKIIKADNSGLVLHSDSPIVFPKICCSCGIQTEKTLRISENITTKSILNPFALFVPIVHIATLLIKEGPTPDIEIPCCTRCSSLFSIGKGLSVAALISAPLAVYLLLYYGHNFPWLNIDALSILILLIFLIPFVPYFLTKKLTLPATVYKTGTGYTYTFHSGVFKNWAETKGRT